MKRVAARQATVPSEEILQRGGLCCTVDEAAKYLILEHMYTVVPAVKVKPQKKKGHLIVCCLLHRAVLLHIATQTNDSCAALATHYMGNDVTETFVPRMSAACTRMRWAEAANVQSSCRNTSKTREMGSVASSHAPRAKNWYACRLMRWNARAQLCRVTAGALAMHAARLKKLRLASVTLCTRDAC